MHSSSSSSFAAYEAELAAAIEASAAASAAPSSSSSAAGALQGRTVISCPALQELPHDLLQLIGSFNADSEFQGDTTHLRQFEILTNGKSLGSFSLETLLMQPDVALCDTIWNVGGRLDTLDDASKKRLKELAPHIRHLNLSRLYTVSYTHLTLPTIYSV